MSTRPVAVIASAPRGRNTLGGRRWRSAS